MPRSFTILSLRPRNPSIRRSFNAEEVPAGYVLEVGLTRDDGAIVFLNGEEIVRDNMPAGLVNNRTIAHSRSDYEDTPGSVRRLWRLWIKVSRRASAVPFFAAFVQFLAILSSRW